MNIYGRATFMAAVLYHIYYTIVFRPTKMHLSIIRVYIQYYIAAAPPRPLNLAIVAGDDRFYALGSFNMARQ